MTIYYFINYKREKIGSINAYKIEQMAKREKAKVMSCDICEFNGELHNEEWLG